MVSSKVTSDADGINLLRSEELVREVNGALDRGELSREDAAEIEAFLAEADRVLGSILPSGEAERPSPEVLDLVERRQAARRARDWTASDRLRDAIAALGWVVEDTAKGPNLKRKA